MGTTRTQDDDRSLFDAIVFSSLYQTFVEAAVNCSWHYEEIVVLMPPDDKKSEAQTERLQQQGTVAET